jgi:hypothetical protein
MSAGGFDQKLLELLGVPTTGCSKAVITCRPGYGVTIEESYVVREGVTDKLKEEVKSFRLVGPDIAPEKSEELRRVSGYVADCLDNGERQGDDEDVPEGSKYITMSDTLAKELAAKLREAAL